MLRDPIAVNRNQTISGSLLFEVNDKFSYCITARVRIDGTDVYSENVINLQDQVPPSITFKNVTIITIYCTFVLNLDVSLS